MRILSLLSRGFRYAVRTYEWMRGWRHYPWSSSPPQRLFSMVANRAYGLPGAGFRALYLFAGGLLKFRERIHMDRVNFAAQVTAPINAETLRNAAIWQSEILVQPTLAPRAHLHLRVREGERVQIDRLVSALLVSDRLGSINLFFDDAAALAARTSTFTVSEEDRGGPGYELDLNRPEGIQPADFDSPIWSNVFSSRTGFDAGVNNYLKIAHSGAFVVALSLAETDDGFCDPSSLQAWCEAIRSFRSPLPNVSFVVLNAVGPEALRPGSAGNAPAFARKAGLSLPEAIRLAQQADAFVGGMDVFGLAARAAQRPGVYVGAESPEMSPSQACQALGEVLVGLSRRPRKPIGRSALRSRAARESVEEEPVTGKYTLVIPTYNRPELLGRALRYLERARASFPILVLDSSKADVQARNKEAIGKVQLDVRHSAYEETMDPYVKIREGLAGVGTPYCSIGADDDVLIVSALPRCVAELERDPGVAVAHGYYFNFREQETFNLSYVMYRGKSVEDARSLARLRTLFAAYEAVFYGVFRTSAAQRAFRDAHRITTVLGKELLTAALSVIAGKAVRIPEFYYGRNTAESLPYHAWHPHQILAHQPELLFTEYPLFRSLLLEGLKEAEPSQDNPAAAKVIDLVFLRYLQPFLGHEVLDLMLDMSLRGQDSAAIYKKVWDRYVLLQRTRRPVEPLVDARGKFSPTAMGSGRPRDYEWSGEASGKERKYRVFYEFMFPEMQPAAVADRERMLSLLGSLNAY